MDLMDLIWIIFLLYIIDDTLNLGIVGAISRKKKDISVLEAQVWALQEQISTLDKKLSYHAQYHNPSGQFGENSGFVNFAKPQEAAMPKGKKWLSWDEKKAKGII